MNNDVKVLLGLTRDDLWALPGILLMFIAFFYSDVPVVGGALLGATFFFSIYFVRTLPKYFRASSLSRFMRLVGLTGNLIVLALLVAIAAGMFTLMMQGESSFDYVRQRISAIRHTSSGDEGSVERLDP